MTQPLNDFERRLAEALHQEASLAMTMTDTPRELRRWHDNQKNRRTRLRVAAAVAVAAAAAGIIVGVTVSAGDQHKQVPATKHPTPAGPRTSTLRSLPDLPSSTHVSALNGPVNLSGSVSFGTVWATGSGTTSGHLYRLDPATGAVLSDTSYAGPVGDGLPPFQVGHVMMLPSAPAHGPKGYLVYAADGRPTGRFVTASTAGAGAGDASGGWVQLTATAIGRVDADGRLVRQVALSSSDQVASIGVGAAGVWVGVGSGDLLHLDPATGSLVARVRLGHGSVPAIAVGAFPTQVLSTSSGLYAALSSHQIARLDVSGQVTAVATVDEVNTSYASITTGPDGNVWAVLNQGGVAALDPRTLALVRGMQVYPNSRDGGVSGMTVTSQRVFLGDIDRTRTVTFATP